MPQIIILMGVSGSGKTTIGKLLVEELRRDLSRLNNWEFHDADDFHPQANIDKMSQGIPLDDTDRKPWLDAMRQAIALWLQQKKNVVLACSALKDNYRRQLFVDPEQMSIVYLKGSFELISSRLQQRQNHYMGAYLLQSQFDSLEEPNDVISVEVSQPPEAIAHQIRSLLKL